MVCHRLSLCFPVTIALVLGFGCTHHEAVVPTKQDLPGSLFLEVGGEVMGTTWSAKVAGHYGEAALVVQGLGDAVEDVDARMSTYKEDSEISRFGRAPADTPFEVSADTLNVVADALRIAGITRGAFDPTIMPLVDLWGFGPAPTPSSAPSAEAITGALAQCGYGKITMRSGGGSSILQKTDAALRLDLSAIAKGHGVDAMAAVLEEAGASHYLVEIGGELRAKGVTNDGSPWLVGIEAPRFDRGPGRPLQAAVALQDLAIATSGDYRNYRMLDGKRYSHTLDPRSGYPVEHDLASVTILAPTCREADAWATACMVLGAEQAMAVIEGQEDLECFLLVREGEDYVGKTSSGFPELQYP